jgi:predicted NUDIX family NTP pyrophosphohydrolase
MKHSAGILCFNENKEVFLLKPGGPWKTDKYTIPKGEYIVGEEEPIEAAIREYNEETCTDIYKDTDMYEIYDMGSSSTRYKEHRIWLVNNPNAHFIESNTFEIEFPANSGIIKEYHECLHGKWFTLSEAHDIVYDSLKPFINTARMILKA